MKTIYIHPGHTVLVDDDDYDRLVQHTWYVLPNGYAYRPVVIDGVTHTIYMHREIMDAAPGVRIDHKNRRKLDNQKSNLREATASTNGANSKMSKRNSTGYRGVYWDKSRNKWMAGIGINGKFKNLGRFSTKEEAAAAYNAAAMEYFGEFAQLNAV